MEKFANSPSNTLNGAINNSVTSLVVHSAATFPSSGNFRILIDSEIMLVTAVSGTTFTVTRGVESTTAASHLDSAPVNGILTADALAAFRSDEIGYDTFANLPSAGSAGREYQTSDSYYRFRDNGSSWDAFGPMFPVTLPIDANYSWVNQGSCTVTTTNGAVVLYAPSNGATDAFRGRVASTPGSTYTVTIGFFLAARMESSHACIAFLIARESSSGKMTAISYGSSVADGTSTFRTFNMSSNTSFSTRTTFIMNNLSPVWFRLQQDSTNITYWVGSTPFDFIQMDTQAKATPFTTAADQFGFGLDPFGNDAKMVVFHVSATSP